MSTPRRSCRSLRRCSPVSCASASATFTSSSIIKPRTSRPACRRTLRSNSRPGRRSSPSSRPSAERHGGARNRWPTTISTTRPATTPSTGSRRILSCCPRSWKATHSITPVRARPRLLMALLPEGVDKSRISEDEWYSRSAREASVELGIKGRDRILAHLRKALGVERANAQGPAQLTLAQNASLSHGTCASRASGECERDAAPPVWNR